MQKVSLKFFFMIACMAMIISCSTNVDFNIKQDLSADVTLNLNVSKNFTNLLERVANYSDSIFNVQEITAILESTGQSKVKVSSLSPADLKISFTSKNITEIFSEQIPHLITASKNDKKTELRMTLNPAVVKQTLTLLPDHAQQFVELLLAPIFTGEKMASTEYLELLAILYGNAIKNDLQNAFVVINFIVPQTIQNAQISSEKLGKIDKSDSSIKVTLSLVELLCLENDEFIEIIW
ncbi:MAG: hypothetical protein ACRC5H_09900 [Treponemataceae bacterium]